jgi:hypothetical protein
MKKSLAKIVIAFIFIIFFMGSSCDNLNQLAINIPVAFEFSASSSNTLEIQSQPEFICLSEVVEWRDNQDNIESAKFLKASYWTLDGTTANLRGDVSFALSASNIILWIIPIGIITAADYVENPLEISLNASEIEAINKVLDSAKANNYEVCFTSHIVVNGVSGDTNVSGERVLNGKVEIVLETEVAL